MPTKRVSILTKASIIYNREDIPVIQPCYNWLKQSKSLIKIKVKVTELNEIPIFSDA